MIRFVAETRGEYPPGLHWTAGEVRPLSEADAAEAPAWLSRVEPEVAPPVADEEAPS